MPSTLPAPAATPRRITIGYLGELLATPSDRARYGVLLATRGREQRDGTVKAVVCGLCFDGARIQVCHRGRRVYDVVRLSNGVFEIQMFDMWVYDADEDTVLEVEGLIAPV